jgi:hypothetical protein
VKTVLPELLAGYNAGVGNPYGLYDVITGNEGVLCKRKLWSRRQNVDVLNSTEIALAVNACWLFKR